MINLVSPGSTGFMILSAVMLIVMVNLWTFAVFGFDKRRAVRGDWRVPEATLLVLAFCGGWIGAKVAQGFFRHKTRKQPFGITLNLIGVAQGLIVAAVVATAVTDGTGARVEFSGFASIAGGSGAGSDDSALPRRFGPGSADWK